MHTDAEDRSTRAEGLTERLGVSARTRSRRPRGADAWLAERRRRGSFRVEPTPLDGLRGWGFAPDTGDLVHDSGRFFAVQGLHVRTGPGPRTRWQQPIIHQSDVAILGVLAKEIDGVLHFLMQAKMEPGNLNTVQLSPTVQATSSNYLRTHRGARPRYLEYFTEQGHGRVLVDLLQSEQGSWFRGKRNRNVVVETSSPVPDSDDFTWLTLGDILDLLRRPHLVNMDTRTVLSCLPAFSRADRSAPDAGAFAAHVEHSFAASDAESLLPHTAVEAWLAGRKAAHVLRARPIPLRDVARWRRTRDEIHHESRRYFRIIGVDVEATTREVASWSQPLLAPCGTGVTAFVVQLIGGTLHILVRADLRAGYRDTVELGPTVQCCPDNLRGAPADLRPAHLDLVLSQDRTRVHYDVEQSEEGGRFHHATTRHLVVESLEPLSVTAPPDHAWVTARQLTRLVQRSHHVNIEARSLLLSSTPCASAPDPHP
ncbi:NDP-hexose 2,3-dehydratase [Nocardiopsis sp. CNR-923]|uniref:NDP-hexose 2,3-dehydratase family protein n=1 Tax=Nocardiopsis sp. CNR-923 TaxID=1904965 RepID=UPI000961FD35|nr:NDP-hexose 2,3-dehydratase family protein [Nocardiopsis sp. CNR-923]OLT29958.1 NDP-hexose 2,3-dehydratase [Nocardiopsis sp. CNR-923]